MISEGFRPRPDYGTKVVNIENGGWFMCTGPLGLGCDINETVSFAFRMCGPKINRNFYSAK